MTKTKGHVTGTVDKYYRARYITFTPLDSGGYKQSLTHMIFTARDMDDARQYAQSQQVVNRCYLEDIQEFTNETDAMTY